MAIYISLVGEPIEHATAYGRIAFSVPHAEQPDIDKRIQETGHKILTPLITLDTPGKATVTVIILADPVSCRENTTPASLSGKIKNRSERIIISTTKTLLACRSQVFLDLKKVLN